MCGNEMDLQMSLRRTSAAARLADQRYSDPMASFTFRIDQVDRDPTERVRSLEDDGEALAYARRLLEDWPECRIIDVVREGELLGRLRRQPQ